MEFVFYTGLTVLILGVLIFLRLFIVALETVTERRKRAKRSSSSKVRTIIVIGSGGHTTEMMYLVQALNLNRYSPRLYVIASSDSWSEQRVEDCERKMNKGTYEIVKIPRSRKVHQSYVTSVFTTLYSIIASIPIVFKFNPEIVLCNGPGTCIPICVIAFLMRCLFLSNNTIIFVESICRVKTLSLSGKILQWFADELLVQWPDLLPKYSRAKYLGRVV